MLVLVETTDLVFAVDSIPAIFAVTTDPFLVYTSNVFAILGLRALYFLLAGVIQRFHFLQLGLSVVLIFVGVKMLLADWYKVPIGLSLGVIAAVLTLSVVVSLLFPKEAEEHAPVVHDPLHPREPEPTVAPHRTDARGGGGRGEGRADGPGQRGPLARSGRAARAPRRTNDPYCSTGPGRNCTRISFTPLMKQERRRRGAAAISISCRRLAMPRKISCSSRRARLAPRQ